jgi:hypothetical protein
MHNGGPPRAKSGKAYNRVPIGELPSIVHLCLFSLERLLIRFLGFRKDSDQVMPELGSSSGGGLRVHMAVGNRNIPRLFAVGSMSPESSDKLAILTI